MIKIKKNDWLDDVGLEPRVIVQGNNLFVLKDLHNKFDGKISCIYIDPPYNNGEEYFFYSDVNSHNGWIEYMRNVLNELKCLLKEDGSIWISINDKEVHYLKVLCDEIFGRKNFINTIIWQQRNTRENRKIFSNNHEYILVYAINSLKFKKKRNFLPITKDILERYSNPDKDSRGVWQSISANVQDGHASKNQYYVITAPNGTKHNPPSGRCWVYNKTRMTDEISSNNIWFGKDGNGVPRIKKFLSESRNGVVPETLWLSTFAGTNKDAKKHLKVLNLHEKVVFDTPKPESLISKVIEIATNENDIVLDAFLGSGTTATTAHKMNRNYIGIEKNSITIEYINERMKKVISGEQGGISKQVNWKGGGDFHLIDWIIK